MEQRLVAAANGGAKPVQADIKPQGDGKVEKLDPRLAGKVLGEVGEALDAAHIPYAVIGGVASASFGRPRWTHDVDILVRPEDAEQVLSVLGERGFDTEMTDHRWIYKAFKYDVLVDVIFRSTGGIYLDREMIDRVTETRLDEWTVKVVPPEDLLIMKAVVHDEGGPRHWHDALGLIAVGHLDWKYLQSRALRAPRRVLSLLVYAHSLDLYVPNEVIRHLFEHVYGR
jgi:predicted nucleotidyltransferase